MYKRQGLYSETDSRKKMADMKKRCEIIEESGADLVVSIHQNSYHEESVSGGQVFYYRDSSKGKALAAILQDRFDYVLGEQNRSCLLYTSHPVHRRSLSSGQVFLSQHQCRSQECFLL